MTDSINVTLPEQPTAPAAEAPHRPDLGPWLEVMLQVAHHYRLDVSPQRIRLAAVEDARPLDEILRHMARQAGLALRFVRFDAKGLRQWRTPLVLELDDGQLAVVESVTEEDDLAVVFAGDQGLTSRLPRDSLKGRINRVALLRPARPLRALGGSSFPWEGGGSRRRDMSFIRLLPF